MVVQKEIFQINQSLNDFNLEYVNGEKEEQCQAYFVKIKREGTLTSESRTSKTIHIKNGVLPASTIE
jgi:hypothetical protein